MTHTYALLEVSHAVFDEIAAKLREAGYDHAFHESRTDGVIIDMHGIALQPPPPKGLLSSTDPLTTVEWAQERLENSVRIAASKSGADRDGWLEDVAYWRDIVGRLQSHRVHQ